MKLLLIHSNSVEWKATKKAIKDLNRRNIPAHVYCHIWELDDQIPLVKMPLIRRWFDYADFRKIRPKMTRLLSDFQFNIPLF